MGPAAPGLIPSGPKFLIGKINDAAKFNQRHSLEESEHCLENVDQTHLLLAIGKLVLLKH